MAILGLTLGLSACSTSGQGAAPTTIDPAVTGSTATTEAPSSTTTTRFDTSASSPTDCPANRAVADLLGGPINRSLSTGGHGSTSGLSYSESGCRYRLTDSDGSVRITRVTVEGAGAGTDFAMLEAEARSDFGSHVGLTIGEFTAFDTGDALVVDEGARPLRITTDKLRLAPAATADLRIALAELVVHGG